MEMKLVYLWKRYLILCNNRENLSCNKLTTISIVNVYILHALYFICLSLNTAYTLVSTYAGSACHVVKKNEIKA